jgi:hypothetical protein
MPSTASQNRTPHPNSRGANIRETCIHSAILCSLFGFVRRLRVDRVVLLHTWRNMRGITQLTTLAIVSSSRAAPRDGITVLLVDDGKLPCRLTLSTHMPICSPLSTCGGSPSSSTVTSRTVSMFHVVTSTSPLVLATTFGTTDVATAPTSCPVELRMGSSTGNLEAPEDRGDGALAWLFAAVASNCCVCIGRDLGWNRGWPISVLVKLAELTSLLFSWDSRPAASERSQPEGKCVE